MKSRQNLETRARQVGVNVDTYSPGDGVTRYRFFINGEKDYFEAGGVYTALGFKEAETWLAGYCTAYYKVKGA